MKPITPEQLKCLNTIVSKQGISKEEKMTIVSGFSNGRVTSSKDLLFSEAVAMIKHLKEFDPNDKMRKKVFALAYEAGIIYGETLEDKKMNAAKLDAFLLTSGTVKKKLIALNRQELIKAVSQFEQMSKHINESKANKATSSLLNELNIQTTKTSNKRI
jgi:hypothetical protein